MALELPLTPAQQAEFDALIPLVNAIVSEAINPTESLFSLTKQASYHTCNHEPPVQSCIDVVNM